MRNISCKVEKERCVHAMTVKFSLKHAKSAPQPASAGFARFRVSSGRNLYVTRQFLYGRI